MRKITVEALGREFAVYQAIPAGRDQTSVKVNVDGDTDAYFIGGQLEVLITGRTIYTTPRGNGIVSVNRKLMNVPLEKETVTEAKIEELFAQEIGRALGDYVPSFMKD